MIPIRYTPQNPPLRHGGTERIGFQILRRPIRVLAAQMRRDEPAAADGSVAKLFPWLSCPSIVYILYKKVYIVIINYIYRVFRRITGSGDPVVFFS